MALYCLVSFIINPLERILARHPILVWQDWIMMGFLLVCSLAFFFEHVLLKFFLVNCLFVAGVMTFLLHPHDSIVQFLGLTLLYKSLELLFAFGFFTKFTALKCVVMALLFWLLIYIAIGNILDSLGWSLMLDLFAFFSFMIHKELILKARKLDEQEKREIEDRMLKELQTERERARQAEEDALTMYHKSQRLEKR